MALVDADYKLIWADIGGMGSALSRKGSFLLLPLPPQPLPPRPRPPATGAGIFFVGFTDVALLLLVGNLNHSVMLLVSSLLRLDNKQNKPLLFIGSHMTAAVRWLCVERALSVCAACALHARCMRAACALHARCLRIACALHAHCMRAACALH